ncbi:MAG: 4-hydroxybenzoyl-CoA reductase subunit beta [Pseudomonadales bacterium]|nr:4-hydroxybenzoyl-CoA reductase subunit beta [Pseudomonadales bacterium]
MELLPEFELRQPKTTAEAVALGAEIGARYIGGGTDFVPNLRRGLETPSAVIDLSEITEMQSIEETGEGLRIGASVTLEQLLSDQRIKEDFLLLAQAAETIAGNTHRQSATVGGNLCLDTRCQFYNQSEWWRKSNNYCLKYRGDICHVAPKGNICRAAFSGDLAPAMMVHGAKVELVSAEGKRVIDLKDLYQEDGANYLLLNPGELLVAVIVEKLEGYQTAYRKVRVRGGVDFPLAGVAVGVKCDENHLTDIRIALTGTNSRPLLIEGVEEWFGEVTDEACVAALVKLVRAQSKPMRSTFTPGSYRNKVVANVARRLIGELINV